MVLELQDVRKRFGRQAVLDGVTLSVPAGQTFAFLGRNGAGKTTTIRMLTGLLRPDTGVVRVLGLDPRRHASAIRRRIGYLAEDQHLFGWMRVEQTLAFMAPFYPTWDGDLARSLLQRFELPRRTRVKHLSKGQNVRLGLLLALAHRPGLVILDDPALGLDPIMRKELNRDVITLLQGEGATVFYSSHLLYEVEPVADRVAILDRGRIVTCENTEYLREFIKQVVVPLDVYETVRALNGQVRRLDVRRVGREVSLVVQNAAELILLLRARGLPHRVIDLNLDEIFEALVIGRPDETIDTAAAQDAAAPQEVEA
jgi:ABC-2 type transport system ATP-binding protein